MTMAKEYDIESAFAAIEDELIDSMIRNMKRHRVEEIAEDKQWEMWQALQLQSLEQYKKDNLDKFGSWFSDINEQIDEVIRQSNQSGRMDQEIEILQAIKAGFKCAKRSSGTMQAEFFKLNERKLEALIKATTDDMKKAETAILRMANDQYRKAIFNAQVYANSGAGTYEKAVDMATKDMLSSGLNCIEYTNGARHTLKDYADMALRTASKRAYIQGEGEMRQSWGISTVIMNKRGNPCPKCLPFCGKVLIDDVWSGGSRKDGPYPLMSEAIAAGLYHPRCKDSHTTYFEGISTPPDDKYTKDEIQQIEDEYKEEQKQQYAKRQAEKFGRLEEYSLDDRNKEKYSAKANEWEIISGNVNIGESGNVESLRIGTNKVALSEIETEAYSRKFNQITGNTSVNDSLRKYANAILTHRNGSDGEDLHIISVKTGKRLFSKTSGTNELGVELSEDEISMIKEYAKSEGIIGIHNHPTNLLPTGSDFVAAGARMYDFGIVVTHDGRVFLYKSGNNPFRSEYLDKTVDKYVSEPYNYDIQKAQIEALFEFGKEFGIEWRELK